MGEAQGSPPGPADVLLCDSFTQVPGDGMVFSLLLTRKELIARSLGATSSSGPPQASFSLSDCVSCHSFKGKDPKDIGGYFTVVFYPLRGMLGSAQHRQRISRTFRTEVSRDKEQNMKHARTWTEKIRQLSAEQGQPYLMPSEVRVLVLLNPHGGTGKAFALFETHVMQMLTEANARFTLLVTERPNQAYEVARDQDLSNWDVIAVMSGDGLIFEVINGLMARQDWADAIKKPLTVLPGGSGNALAASINYYSGHQQVTGHKLLTNCAFIMCRGQPLPLDIVSLTTSSGKRLFSFLALAWGLISDADIESEKYRFMGYARFSIGTLVRLTALRTYSGRLSFLPAKSSTPEMDNVGDSPQPDRKELEDQLLVPLDQPVPAHWHVVEDRFVLVLAVYQSHIGAEHIAAPMMKGSGEGLIHLFYATSRISRTSLLKLFMAMEKGTHMDHNVPHLTHLPVTAFRIEPRESTGIMTVDGEVIQCSPIQGQIHRGLGRVLSIAPNANGDAV